MRGPNAYDAGGCAKGLFCVGCVNRYHIKIFELRSDDAALLIWVAVGVALHVELLDQVVGSPKMTFLGCILVKMAVPL